MFNFEQLDDITRQHMLSEFRAEEVSGNPYRSTRLSPAGLLAFPKLMVEAILHGNEETLAQLSQIHSIGTQPSLTPDQE